MKLTKEDLLKTSNAVSHRVFEQLSEDYSIESAIDDAQRTIWFTAISNDNGGVRETYSGMRYVEIIDVASVVTTDFRTFLCDHTASTSSAVGKIVSVEQRDGALKVQVKFSTTPDAEIIFRKYSEEILTSVSIGYRYDVNDAEILDIDSEMPIVTLRNVQLFELSSVVFPFDKDAKVGRSSDSVILNDIITPEKSVSSAAVQKRIHLMRLELKL